MGPVCMCVDCGMWQPIERRARRHLHALPTSSSASQKLQRRKRKSSKSRAPGAPDTLDPVHMLPETTSDASSDASTRLWTFAEITSRSATTPEHASWKSTYQGAGLVLSATERPAPSVRVAQRPPSLMHPLLGRYPRPPRRTRRIGKLVLQITAAEAAHVEIG